MTEYHVELSDPGCYFDSFFSLSGGLEVDFQDEHRSFLVSVGKAIDNWELCSLLTLTKSANGQHSNHVLDRISLRKCS
jgi:hypothetical protein